MGQLVWLVLLRGPGTADRPHLLIIGQIVLTLPLLGILALLRTTPPGAIKLTPHASRGIILQTTALLQVAALLLLAPVASQDLARSRADGRMWLAGSSPYVVPPTAFFATHAPDALDRLVPFPDDRALCPPVAETIFALCRAADPDVRAPLTDWHTGVGALPWWDRAPAFRAAMAAFAVAATAMLVSLLARAGRSPWYAVLFAWSPLLLIESAGGGHVDVAGAFFLLAALRLLPRRPGWAGAMVLLATGVKPQAALLLPFLVRDGGFDVVRGFVLAAVPAALPLLYHHGYDGLLATAAAYSDRWEANGSLYELSKSLFGQGDLGRNMIRAKDAARLLAQAAVLVTLYRAWTRRATPAAAGCAAQSVLLLTAPVAYPWYLLWATAFLPLAPAWTPLVWSATIGIAYTTWTHPAWRVPPEWLVVEYVPVFLAAAVDLAPSSWFGRTRHPERDAIPVTAK